MMKTFDKGTVIRTVFLFIALKRHALPKDGAPPRLPPPEKRPHRGIVRRPADPPETYDAGHAPTPAMPR